PPWARPPPGRGGPPARGAPRRREGARGARPEAGRGGGVEAWLDASGWVAAVPSPDRARAAPRAAWPPFCAAAGGAPPALPALPALLLPLRGSRRRWVSASSATASTSLSWIAVRPCQAAWARAARSM